MPLIALGGLWVILWQGRARALGVLPIAVAMALWGTVQRPDVLIAGSGGLVGVMTPEGRALSKARGDGFAAESWLENDGDPVGQEAAYARAGFAGDEGARRAVARRGPRRPSGRARGWTACAGWHRHPPLSPARATAASIIDGRRRSAHRAISHALLACSGGCRQPDGETVALVRRGPRACAKGPADGSRLGRDGGRGRAQ